MAVLLEWKALWVGPVHLRNRVQKIIDRAGARIGGILSDIFGVNCRKILDGLAQGTAREIILASLTSHVANKLEGLGEALSLSLGDNDRFMLNDLLEEHDALEARIASYTKKIDGQMTPWEEQLRLLTTRRRLRHVPHLTRAPAREPAASIARPRGSLAQAGARPCRGGPFPARSARRQQGPDFIEDAGRPGSRALVAPAPSTGVTLAALDPRRPGNRPRAPRGWPAARPREAGEAVPGCDRAQIARASVGAEAARRRIALSRNTAVDLLIRCNTLIPRSLQEKQKGA